MQSSRRWRVSVDERYCSGCGICIDMCPHRALIRGTELNARGIYAPCQEEEAACKGCHLCELYCGNFAIAVEQVADEQ